MESCVLYCADNVVPVEGDKGAAGVAIETTVANCARYIVCTLTATLRSAFS